MSTEAAAPWLVRRGFADDVSTRVLRLSIGIAFAAAVALGIGWPLSYMAPVLATSLLASRAPCPTLASGAALVAIIAMSGALGLFVVAPLALHYPLVCAVALGGMLFGIFHAAYRGASPLLALFLLLAVLLIPLVASSSMLAAQEVTWGLIAGGGAAVAITWVAHALVPDLQAGNAAVEPAQPGTPNPDDTARRAAATTVVVYPVALLFYGFGLTGDLLVLIFIAILAQQPSLAAGRQAGVALIVGNLAGGIAAMVFYELVVAVPSFGFFLALVFLTTLLLGARIFSADRFASIYPTVLSTLLLLVGGSVAPYGDDVGVKFPIRIAQIGVAVVYVVGTAALIERLRRHRSQPLS